MPGVGALVNTRDRARRRPLRVLHVINGLFYGGGHHSTSMLVKEMTAMGTVSATLCTLGSHEGSPLEVLSPIRIPYDGRYNHPVVLLQTARHLTRLIDEHAFDVVHTHGLDADLVGAIACLGRGTRHVSHLRITPAWHSRHSWRRQLGRVLFHGATRITGTTFIAVSQAVCQEMASYYRLPLRRINVVRNGIDVARFAARTRPACTTAVDGRRCVIGAAARLAPMKGLEYLIEAVSGLREAGTPCELRIAGEGGALPGLQQLVASFGLQETVTFVGRVRDMPAFYRQLDIFALPSVSQEGLPLSVLEAMACGLPVVATTIGGTPEIIHDGVEGMLVEPADIAGLRRALAALAANPELRDRLARAGQRRVRAEFTVARVATQVSDVYASLF
jgi:glycosyltransferase involved in cell wall biosynthesis